MLMAFQPVQSGCWQSQVAYRCPGATDALDNADVVGDHGQPGPARRDLLSAVFLAGEGDELGQKSVE
jgi:hypothetical protein